LRRAFFLIPLVLACFGLLPTVRATCQQGCNTVLNNTFLGDNALVNDTSGSFNTATGADALQQNTTGTANTATGYEALYSNTTVNGVAAGSDNTANGFGALSNNTSGDGNTADGYNALVNNTSGGANTADGQNALYSNTTGVRNTADGQNALYSNTTGSFNTAYGVFALQNATGINSNHNIALGYFAGFNLTTGNNNIDIGNRGVMVESKTIRIGTETTQTATYIAGIFNEPVGPNNLPVLIDNTGKLGTFLLSARRFKHDIQPMDKASEAILALKPVTFHYKSDAKNTPCFGLIAEEVAEVNPNLIVRDKNGEILSVRYDQVNAMLLNEFLKEHRTVQELKTTVVEQQKQIEALAAGLQQVSAQLELGKSAPQTVLNNP
jgi:hypothetical protein